MRVLLIEDEPTTARAIELMLTTEGFNVYSTDLGEEGLDLGKLYDYDIILLDLNLPDMHGYDVLKKLRVAKVQTPALILSAEEDPPQDKPLGRFRVSFSVGEGKGAAPGAAEHQPLFNAQHFLNALGVEFLGMAGGRAQVALKLKPEHMNSWQVTHGGVVMTLLDVVMSLAGRSLDPDSRAGVTVEMKTSFLQPAGQPGGRVDRRARRPAWRRAGGGCRLRRRGDGAGRVLRPAAVAAHAGCARWP